MKNGFLGFLVVAATACLASGCQQRIEEKQAAQINTPIESQGALSAEGLAPSASDSGAQAQEQLQSAQAPDLSATPAEEPVTAEAAQPSAQEVQQALKNAGFYSGDIDGKVGPRTKKAIEEFQTKNGLKVDGKVGSQTWGRLKEYLNTVAVTSGEAKS